MSSFHIVALICIGLSVVLFLAAYLFTEARWYERYWWLYLLGVFVLFATGIGSIFLQDVLYPVNSRFYVFPDPAGIRTLLINDKPYSAYAQTGNRTHIELRGRQASNRVQIVGVGSIERDENLPQGIYAANLSDRQWILSEEIHYSRWNLPHWKLVEPEKRPVGIYPLADAEHLDAVVYDFNTSPPEKIPVRSRSRGNPITATLKNSQKNKEKAKRIEQLKYFDLRAGTW